MPLLFITYIFLGMTTIWALFMVIVFCILHIHVMMSILMVLIVLADYASTFHFMLRLDQIVNYETYHLPRKMIMSLSYNLALITFKSTQHLLIDPKFRGEGLSYLLILVKAVFEFLPFYLVWSYMARIHKKVDEDGKWIEDRRQTMDEMLA